MTAFEFSHPLRLDTLGDNAAKPVRLSADEAARARLANRFGIEAVEALEAALTVRRERGDEIQVDGTLNAVVIQACVVTLEPVTTAVEVPIDVRLVPETAAGLDEPVEDGDVVLEDGGPDLDTYGAGGPDLGEVVAQTLALHLPAYPRAPDALDAGTLDAGSDGDTPPEGTHRPFSGLKDLLKKP